jgi:hypothetical protein
MKIIDILESSLFESAGGISKRWLESQKKPMFFTDKAGNRYQFENLVILPLESPVLPMAELEQELANAVTQLKFRKQEVRAVNKPPVKQGAAMMVVMVDQDGRRFPFVRFFPKRDMDQLGMFWQTSTFQKDTGLTWEQTRVTGTGKDRRAEVITRVELKPLHTVPVNTNMAIGSVPDQVVSGKVTEQLGPELAQKLGQLARNVLQGRTDAVAGLVPYERDIGVDFGEVVAPLAMVSRNLAGGNYQQVETDLLRPLGVSWTTATMVFYPEAENEALVDSQLGWPDGTVLRISSKAKDKGGAASTTSLYETIQKYPERFSNEDKAMLAQGGRYYPFVNALKTISTNQTIPGTLKLGVDLGIINEQETQIIMQYVANKVVSGTQGLTKNLINLLSVINAKTELPDYKVCWHLMAVVAKSVVQKLNQDKSLTAEFIKFILSRANLIQVGQYTHREGDGVGYTKFNVVWPPVFKGFPSFSSADFQTNKRPSNKIAFKVPGA